MSISHSIVHCFIERIKTVLSVKKKLRQLKTTPHEEWKRLEKTVKMISTTIHKSTERTTD